MDMSTGCNVAATYELQEDGYDIELVQQMVDAMGAALKQFPSGKERVYLEEIVRDIYPWVE
jgi:hypothetical protein